MQYFLPFTINLPETCLRECRRTATYQPINLSTYQPINLSTCQPINQSTTNQ